MKKAPYGAVNRVFTESTRVALMIVCSAGTFDRRRLDDFVRVFGLGVTNLEG